MNIIKEREIEIILVNEWVNEGMNEWMCECMIVYIWMFECMNLWMYLIIN